jgi:hypothetical protein
MPEHSALNPQVQEVQIGILDLRMIKLFPLSLGDQLALTDTISEELSTFFKEFGKSDNNIVFINFTVNLIRENIVKILNMIAYEDGENGTPEKIKVDEEELLNTLTNLQLSEIVRIIYETNFEAPGKNVEALIKRIQTIFQLKGQLPLSANDMDTDLQTSTEEAS